MPREIREVTERFRLDRLLKSGPTATVLRATEIASGRSAVAKLLNPGADPTAIDRFESYAETLAAIEHPAIPTVLDWGISGDGPYLVFEWLEGRNFSGFAGTSQRRIASHAVHAFTGLEALFEHGLVHGNLIPENLFIETTREGQRLRLVGLGTSVFWTPGTVDRSETARFRAPEWPTTGPTQRADLYSLGRSVCEVLSAEIEDSEGAAPKVSLPFSFELERADALCLTLAACLRKNPSERPASIDDVRRPLKAALGKGLVNEPTWLPRPRTPAAAEPELPPTVRLTPELDFDPPTLAQEAPPPLSPLAAASPVPLAPIAPIAPIAPTSPTTPSTVEPTRESLSFAAAESLESIPDAGPLLPDIDLGEIPEGPPRSTKGAPAPPPPTPTPLGGTAPTTTGTTAPTAPTAMPTAFSAARPTRKPRAAVYWIGGSIAGALLAGFGYWKFRPEPTPPPIVRESRPTGPTKEPAAERLAAAQIALAEGDYGRAQEIALSLDAADQASLGADGCRSYQAVLEVIPLLAAERLESDLAKGLEEGDVELLRRVVLTAPSPAAAISTSADLAASLERARTIVRFAVEADAAARAGNHAQALERFALLAPLLPASSPSLAMRAGSGAAIEAKARGHLERGEYALAEQAYAPLLAHWPDRPGLKEDISKIRTYQAEETTQKALLETLPRFESRRKPDEGLVQLRAVEPIPLLAARFAELERRLSEQLARIDAKAPTIELSSGYATQYFRGTVVNLGFRVTDDYKVTEVKISAGGRNLKAKKVGTRWDVEIPPSLHGNRTMSVIAVGTDVSGHEGRLAVEISPIGATRRLVR